MQLNDSISEQVVHLVQISPPQEIGSERLPIADKSQKGKNRPWWQNVRGVGFYAILTTLAGVIDAHYTYLHGGGWHQAHVEPTFCKSISTYATLSNNAPYLSCELDNLSSWMQCSDRINIHTACENVVEDARNWNGIQAWRKEKQLDIPTFLSVEKFDCHHCTDHELSTISNQLVNWKEAEAWYQQGFHQAPMSLGTKWLGELQAAQNKTNTLSQDQECCIEKLADAQRWEKAQNLFLKTDEEAANKTKKWDLNGEEAAAVRLAWNQAVEAYEEGGTQAPEYLKEKWKISDELQKAKKEMAEWSTKEKQLKEEERKDSQHWEQVKKLSLPKTISTSNSDSALSVLEFWAEMVKTYETEYAQAPKRLNKAWYKELQNAKLKQSEWAQKVDQLMKEKAAEADRLEAERIKKQAEEKAAAEKALDFFQN